MTASNDSLNSAFTDDEPTSRREIPEVAPPSESVALEEPETVNGACTVGDEAAAEDWPQTSMLQASAETDEVDDYSEPPATKDPIAFITVEEETSADVDRESSMLMFAVKDDVSEQGDNDGDVESNSVQENITESVPDAVVEVGSTPEQSGSPANVDDETQSEGPVRKCKCRNSVCA